MVDLDNWEKLLPTLAASSQEIEPKGSDVQVTWANSNPCEFGVLSALYQAGEVTHFEGGGLRLPIRRMVTYRDRGVVRLRTKNPTEARRLAAILRKMKPSRVQ